MDIGIVHELPITPANTEVHIGEEHAAHHANFRERSNGTVNILLNQEAAIDKVYNTRWLQRDLNEKHETEGKFELLWSNGSKRFTGQHELEYVEIRPSNQENKFKSHCLREWKSWYGYYNINEMLTNSCSQSDSHDREKNSGKVTSKRVAIHMRSQTANSEIAKMINLPSTMEELLRIGGK